MKPLPKEKRELIISAKKRGEKEEKIALWLEVSVRSVSRIWKLYQETESIQPKKQPGKKPSVTENDMRRIRETIKKQPDITLEELIETLNLPIKKSRLSVILIGMGLSFKKKTLFPKEQLREDVQKERKEWVEKIKNVNPNRFVFLDETSVNCGMTRLYGRAPKNERVYDYVPDVRFKRTSVISTIRLNGESVTFMFKGTLDGNLFIGYIEQYLAPTLKENDILVLDSCSAHKKYELDAVHDAGASVWFLPRYSPDLNPCENAWSKSKSTLRKEKARNETDLEKAMGHSLEFSQSDLIGWFSHCGYNVNI